MLVTAAPLRSRPVGEDWQKVALMSLARHPKFAFLCAFLASLLLAPAAWGQELRMRVWPGFDGVSKSSQWVPVAVELTNRGGPVTGTLLLPVINGSAGTYTTYHRPVTLGGRARQVVTLYIRSEMLADRLQVTLQPDRGGVIAAEGALDTVSGGDRLIVVLDREPGSLAFLSGALSASAGGRSPSEQRREVRVADGDPDLLPDAPCGYATADLLLIGDIPTRQLRAEVKAAIRQWVRGGGTVVISGGADWARLRDPFLQQLLPVQVLGAAPVANLAGLSSFFGPLSGNAVLTRAAPRPGALVLAQQDGLPLVVEGTLGAGKVIFLAFDVARPPLRSWPGQNALWNVLFSRADAGTRYVQAVATDSRQGVVWRLGRLVMNVPSMKAPPLWWLGVFLVTYLLVLVPVNYGLLKWRRRLELAWFTTPLIVIAFTLLAYSIGFSMKGGALLLNEVSLVETIAGSRWAASTTFTGIFSPARTSYDLQARPAGCAITEVNPIGSGWGERTLFVRQTETMSLPQARFDMWSMRVFRLDGTVDLGGAVEGVVELHQGWLTGHITNRTSSPLTHCSLRWSNATQPLPNLAAGATANIQLAVGGGMPAGTVAVTLPPNPSYQYFYGPGSTNYGSADPYHEVNDLLFSGTRPAAVGPAALFVGWSKSSYASLAIRGSRARHSPLTCLLVHVPVHVGSGPVLFPFGATAGAVVEAARIRIMEWELPAITMQAGGYIIKDFYLPGLGASFRPTVLLAIADYQGQAGRLAYSSQPALEIYNWGTRSWDRLTLTGNRASDRAPAAHVRLPQGQVRLRFSYRLPTASGRAELMLRELDISVAGTAR